VQQYFNSKFASEYVPTKGVETNWKYLHFEGKVVKQTVLDTSGDPTIVPILRTYYSTVRGFVLMYDTTRRNTLEFVYRTVRELPTNVPKIIVGNKADKGPATTA
jgi:GTPase SAR1 family protein